MRRKNLDLIVIMIIAALNVVWMLIPNHIPVIGISLALPLVFVLPGYTLTELMFHRRSLAVSHRIIFSLGLSLAIVVLGGLTLNLLPFGLRESSWVLLLVLLTMVFSLIAAYLRIETPVNGVRLPKLRFTTYSFVLLWLAILVTVLTILYDANGEAQQPHSGFTQLWVLPASQAGKSCAVHLGVQSFESTTVTYLIELTVEKAQAARWSPVVLAPQGEWDQLVPLNPKSTANVFIEVQLYRLDKPQTIYREVHMTLSNCSTPQTPPTPHPVHG